ncbi:MAG: 3'(2'),5'-bisphosphate nucleotidase CysQ [Candidatus Sumerlaeota bacterium]|nr:3'(2'),5'-bisphosphate nucleotidase CysQ [Candidatus Sumerlaeota bacterium]
MKLDREDELALRVAVAAAKAAWKAIAGYYGGSLEIRDSPDGPSTTADRLANRVIVERLQEVFPPEECGYLSEESADNVERRERNRVWIIDPLDGTLDFIEHKDSFCIQIGLVRRWHARYRPVASVVYAPIQGRIVTALSGRGAWAMDAEGAAAPKRLRVSGRSRLEELRTVMSRSHVTPALERLTQALRPAEVLRFGSLGQKVCAIAEGEADYYLNVTPGSTKEWDCCAPELILAEAGGRMTNLRGTDLAYNKRDVRDRLGLLASNGASHEALLAAIRRHLARDADESLAALREAMSW